MLDNHLFSDILYDKLKTVNGIYNANDILIVLNGEFLTSQNKFVYIDGTNSSNSNGNSIRLYINNYKEHTRLNINSKLNAIYHTLISSNLYGVETGVSPSIDECYFMVDYELGILFIESALYRVTKQAIMKHQKGNYRVYVGYSKNNIIDSTTLKKLINAFNRRAISNYINFALSASILRKVNKRNKFYTIQKTFIPVMVTSKFIYNPLLENEDYHFQDTEMYKEMQKQWVEVIPDNVLGAYMLTHKQICKCLHMKKFMRFSSQVVYAVIAGLLNPAFSELPSVSCKTMVAPKSNAPTVNLKRTYSQNEFDIKYQELLNKIANSSGEEQMQARLDLEILQSYVERDSLFALCIINRNILSNIGPTILDNPKDTTETKYYEYLREAKLWN